jgi:hypothetical protein
MLLYVHVHNSAYPRYYMCTGRGEILGVAGEGGGGIAYFVCV